MILTAQNFDQEVLQAPGITFVEFFATWCPHCQAFAPEYKEISEELGGEAKFYQVEIDESPGLTQEYGINAIPTIVVFNNGTEETVLEGAQPESVFQETINELS